LEEFVVPCAISIFLGAGLLSPDGALASKGFMESLPDPMRPQLGVLLFVMALITILFIFMKYVFFKPIIKVMDEREEAIQSGAASREEATALVESRQAEYAGKLRALRTQAFEHGKALAAAAAKEKTTLVDQARAASAATRATAMSELQAARESAKTELMVQVEALSDSMVQHLLKRA
jgi:F-type H+-transporting ATPase subunit b